MSRIDKNHEVKARVYRHAWGIAIDDTFYASISEMASAIEDSPERVRHAIDVMTRDGVLEVISPPAGKRPYQYRILRLLPDPVQAVPKAPQHHTVWRDPDALPYFERLWTTTKMSPPDVAAVLNAAFGMAMTGDRVSDHARKRGFKRPIGEGKQVVVRSVTKATPNLIAAKQERHSLEQILRPDARVSNPVRLVEPKTHHYEGGFRIGAAR